MILLEFMAMLKEGNHIEHPEDLVFTHGTAGATAVLSTLSNLHTNLDSVKIKFDGFPALVWGRNVDGELVVADKHMFSKKDGSGRVTSLAAFIQYDKNRGADRSSLYQKLQILWDGLENSIPPDFRGYYWGDLLWAGRPAVSDVSGEYVFKPNTVTYSVAPSSQMGKKISASIGGIVVHQFFPDYNEPAQVLNGTGELNTAGPICFISTEIPRSTNIRQPVQLVNAANALIKKNGANIDNLVQMATVEFKQIPQLLKQYVNAVIRGESRQFSEWAVEKVAVSKLPQLQDFLGKHATDIRMTFEVYHAIMNLKNNLVSQLDQFHSDIHSSINNTTGGEGYVVQTEYGLIKMVNRAMFSAANFAKNM